MYFVYEDNAIPYDKRVNLLDAIFADVEESKTYEAVGPSGKKLVYDKPWLPVPKSQVHNMHMYLKYVTNN